MKIITERINSLRQMMQYCNIAAYIIPSSDPHLSEYVADHWKKREWISGFNGSAGTVVILKEKAGLWTDSRYFLQAEQQLSGSEIELFKEGYSSTPDFLTWIIQNIPRGSAVGIDGETFSAKDVEDIRIKLYEREIELKTEIVLINDKWAKFPPLPENKIFILDEKFSGLSASKKIELIGKKLNEEKADILLLSALDEIAWTFNIRGNDIEYNPVVIAFAIVAKDSACLFIDEKKLTPQICSYLKNNRIEIRPYLTIFEVLSKLPKTCKILIDKQKNNFTLYNTIPYKESILDKVSPVSLLKAVKNEIEINGTKNAMIKDGIALIHAFYHLEKELENREKVTELSFSNILKSYRKKEKDFFEESFGTIAGFGVHGAIVHYKAQMDNDFQLLPNNLFLIDSGANYYDGTTDITRTIVIGKPSKQQKRDYTNVLKGHIALATIKFPEKTHGVQLDILARQFLWNETLNYGHGTGHGVGHFLCVHEGPQNIRIADNGIELVPGMIISNEPGLYREGEYGIRLENLILVKRYKNGDFGSFLEFETLTLFPFEKELINTEMLSDKEITWINNYHKTVYEKLSPFLCETEKAWLKNKTNLIFRIPKN